MVKVCVTIDTEGDSAENKNSTFLGIKYILPRFLELFSKYDVKATFFVQEDKFCDVASKFLKKFKRIESYGHEVGLHSHGLIEYDNDEISDTIKDGADSLRSLGFNPVSFRAGRFHYRAEMTKILEESGIKYDSSVCPGLREFFSDGRERCNHLNAETKPYFLSYENHTIAGQSNVLEIPINRYPFSKGSSLKGGFHHEPVLYDYFAEKQKDDIIIILLHSWTGLSSSLLRFVRSNYYNNFSKFNYNSFAKLLFKTNKIYDKMFFRNFETLLTHISEKSGTVFSTLSDAGKHIQTRF